jgi:hypothetical protein
VLAAGFDAGVRYDERLEKDMIAVPLSGPQRFMLVGSPAYFAAHGRPAHPRDVLDHASIRHRFPSGASYSWEFEKDGEVIRLNPPARLTSTSSTWNWPPARPAWACSPPSRTSWPRASRRDGWSGAWKTGCRRSRGRTCTIRAAGTCPRRCGRSWIS